MVILLEWLVYNGYDYRGELICIGGACVCVQGEGCIHVCFRVFIFVCLRERG